MTMRYECSIKMIFLEERYLFDTAVLYIDFMAPEDFNQIAESSIVAHPYLLARIIWRLQVPDDLH